MNSYNDWDTWHDLQDDEYHREREREAEERFGEADTHQLNSNGS